MRRTNIRVVLISSSQFASQLLPYTGKKKKKKKNLITRVKTTVSRLYASILISRLRPRAPSQIAKRPQLPYILALSCSQTYHTNISRSIEIDSIKHLPIYLPSDNHVDDCRSTSSTDVQQDCTNASGSKFHLQRYASI